MPIAITGLNLGSISTASAWSVCIIFTESNSVRKRNHQLITSKKMSLGIENNREMLIIIIHDYQIQNEVLFPGDCKKSCFSLFNFTICLC